MKKLTFWFNVVFAGPLLLVAAYAVWYWTHDHAALTQWYLSLNPNLYHVDEWRNTLFTPATKASGNWWCTAAIVAAGVVFLLGWKYPPRWPEWQVRWRKETTPWLFVGTLAGWLALLTAARTVKSADEVFSQLNFAEMSIFQTLSYYIRPNNHVLFNSLNGVVTLGTGRFIAVGCYVLFICSVWYFLQKWFENRWQTALATAVVAVQFPVWGFATQGRGYELQLLLGWWSLTAFLDYQRSGNQRALAIHTACNVLGMWTLPTYLYWWLGLGISATILAIQRRRMDWPYLRHSVIGGCFALIVYLPVLTFSGWNALADNRYVRPGNDSIGHFFSHLNDHRFLNGLFTEWFSIESPGTLLPGLIGLALPLLLLWGKSPENRSERRQFLLLTYVLLATWLLVSAGMSRLPFYRNLIAQGSLVLLAGVLASGVWSARWRFGPWIWAAVWVLWIGQAVRYNWPRIPDNLYYYQVAGHFNDHNPCAERIRKQGQIGSVYLDDDCFYWWHLLGKERLDRYWVIDYNRPSFHGQTCCIVPADSLPPGGDTLHYRLLEKCRDYGIWLKK